MIRLRPLKNQTTQCEKSGDEHRSSEQAEQRMTTRGPLAASLITHHRYDAADADDDANTRHLARTFFF